MFARGTCLLDLRSEVEVLSGSLPNAINLPILTSTERELVGTTYARHGSSAAYELGLELVSGQVREQRIQQWADALASHNIKAVYCWRGGLRSSIAQEWLLEKGITVKRLPGGFKQLRNFLREELALICNTREIVSVWGMTGCAKTSALSPHAERIGFVDLEAIAQHRGSAFGCVYDSQPAQVTFENELTVAAIRVPQTRPIIFEAESKLIGRCALPETLLQAILSSKRIIVEDSLENRVDRIIEEYIIFLLKRFRTNDLDLTDRAENVSHKQLEEFLLKCLTRIHKKLGGERTAQLGKLIVEACHAQAKSGDAAAHRPWITLLLQEYYDPQYEYYSKLHNPHTVMTRCLPTELLSVIEGL